VGEGLLELLGEGLIELVVVPELPPQPYNADSKTNSMHEAKNHFIFSAP
jgi:hypothetical protein